MERDSTIRLRLYLSRLRPLPAIHKLEAPAKPIPSGSIERLTATLQDIRVELSTTNGRVKNLKSQIARVRDPEAARLAGIREQIAAGEARAVELRKEILHRDKLRIDEKDLRGTMQSFEGVWKAMNLVEQRALLAQLVEKIGYDARTGKITVSFKSASIRALCK